MKLSGTGQRQGKYVSPFGSLLQKPLYQTVGAGIGVNRLDTGFRTKGDSIASLASLDEALASRPAAKETRRGQTEKVRDFSSQALGETPPRDGPFSFGAASVATNTPTGAIQKKSAVAREKRQRVNPLGFGESG